MVKAMAESAMTRKTIATIIHAVLDPPDSLLCSKLSSAIGRGMSIGHSESFTYTIIQCNKIAPLHYSFHSSHVYIYITKTLCVSKYGNK